MNLIAFTYGPVLFAIMIATIYTEIRDIRSSSSSKDTITSAKEYIEEHEKTDTADKPDLIV